MSEVSRRWMQTCVASVVRYLSALAALSSIGAAPVWAQTEVKTLSAAQSLACLVRPKERPAYPEHSKLDRGHGAMRLRLRFKSPDEPPDTEVLFNSARQDMQDLVFRYVATYRLPCLTAADGVVSAVQEFDFRNNDRDATPLPPEPNPQGGEPAFCIVMPRADIDGYYLGETFNTEHVVAAATFSGDGSQPPEVKILYSTGFDRLERVVRERLAEYRMPCRKAGSAPQSFHQQFSIFSANRARYGFKREAFSLAEFLSMTRNPLEQKVRFDFDTMGCPFKVSYKVYGGSVPNEAHEVRHGDKPDPNKVPFLAWLASLNIAFTSARQAKDLFGSELQIAIPCTVLDLQG